jgi:hypothetical protein
MSARASAWPRRLLVVALTATLSVIAAWPIATVAQEAELTATLELPQGEIDFVVEPGTLHFFDEEGAPFAIQVIDGCAVNDHWWLLGVGLGTAALPLTIFDERTGMSSRTVLPAFRPGEPIGAVFEPEALATCRPGPTGGLPPAGGTAVYTAASPQCPDAVSSLELRSDGEEAAYRSFVRGAETDRVISDDPIAVIDASSEWDELHLLAEGRTPRQVEGVMFSGDEGMLPRQASLEAALDDITRSRVRRAFEAAKNKVVPRPLIEDLGLGEVGCVFHVSLDLETLGADAYLAEAGWIRDGGPALEPPQLVEPRFSVELASSDGDTTDLPLTGPYQGTAAEGAFWEHATDSAKVVIVDGCDLSGTFWTVAAAVTAEPLELTITDPSTGTSATSVLWTDREETSRLVDTASLSGCP